MGFITIVFGIYGGGSGATPEVPLCLAQTALPVRTIAVSPASVRTLEQTALATRTLTITLEVCDE